MINGTQKDPVLQWILCYPLSTSKSMVGTIINNFCWGDSPNNNLYLEWITIKQITFKQISF